MQSIHQQLITFGLIPKFLYQGVERLSPARAEEVHVWAVQLTGPTGAVLEDKYRATRNEYQAMRDGETTVTEQYMLDFIERLKAVERTGTGDYERWLDLQGVGFGVTIEDTQANQEFWRARFVRDVRCFKGLALLLGSRDLVADFLSTTISR
jgi:hypothetical protein